MLILLFIISIYNDPELENLCFYEVWEQNVDEDESFFHSPIQPFIDQAFDSYNDDEVPLPGYFISNYPTAFRFVEHCEARNISLKVFESGEVDWSKFRITTTSDEVYVRDYPEELVMNE